MGHTAVSQSIQWAEVKCKAGEYKKEVDDVGMVCLCTYRILRPQCCVVYPSVWHTWADALYSCMYSVVVVSHNLSRTNWWIWISFGYILLLHNHIIPTVPCSNLGPPPSHYCSSAVFTCKWTGRWVGSWDGQLWNINYICMWFEQWAQWELLCRNNKSEEGLDCTPLLILQILTFCPEEVLSHLSVTYIINYLHSSNQASPC